MKVKASTLAGTWYPRDAEELRRTVDDCLAAAPPPGPSVLALVVPHAGYRYAGSVAGVAYRQLAGAPGRRVVILAPSHRLAFRGVALPDADAFSTPLGTVAVDGAVSGLAGRAGVHVDPGPFEGEHSLEIQLPFLQRVVPGATVVPLLCGHLGGSEYRALAPILDALAGPDTVFVISSDFTHYGWRFGYEPFPATDAAAVRRGLHALDMGAIDPVLRRDAAAFERYLAETGDTVCGRIPLTAFLTWPGIPHAGRLLAYRTSLDVTGDYEHCVSYAAIAFPRA
jgi:hypothetical protein